MRSITNQTQLLEHELPNKIHYPISTYINIQLSLHSQFWHRGTCAVCNMWPSRRRLWDQLSPQSFCFSEENWKSLWDKTEETSRLHNIWLCLKIAYQQILLSIILFPCISRKMATWWRKKQKKKHVPSTSIRHDATAVKNPEIPGHSCGWCEARDYWTATQPPPKLISATNHRITWYYQFLDNARITMLQYFATMSITYYYIW